MLSPFTGGAPSKNTLFLLCIFGIGEVSYFLCVVFPNVIRAWIDHLERTSEDTHSVTQALGVVGSTSTVSGRYNSYKNMCSSLDQNPDVYLGIMTSALVKLLVPLPLDPVYSVCRQCLDPMLRRPSRGLPAMICWQVWVLGPRCPALPAPESAALKRELKMRHVSEQSLVPVHFWQSGHN